MPFIRRIPVAMSALALGLAAMGNLLAAYPPIVRTVCGAAATIVVALLVLRLVTDFAGVAEDLKSPANLAVAPAFPMALMVLATYLKPLAATAALWLWVAALALQVGIVALFLVRHVLSLKVQTVLPSWFLVFVGFVVASVTSPAFAMQPVGQALLYAGMAGYALALGLVLYRMTRHGDLPEPALPTVAIFAAPPSLCLVGYLAVTEAKQAPVVYALLALAAVSLLYVFSRLPRILRLGFQPSFAALTFPFVISAIAIKLSLGFLATAGLIAAVPALVTTALDLAVAAMVLYVLARYVAFLAAPARD